MEWTSDVKKRFRNLKKWKKFREEMIKKTNYTCELCGTKYIGKRKKMLNLHHLDEFNYDDLDPKKFKVLCSTCHRDIVEKMILRFGTKDFKDFHLYKEWKSLFIKAKLLDKKYFEEKENELD